MLSLTLESWKIHGLFRFNKWNTNTVKPAIAYFKGLVKIMPYTKVLCIVYIFLHFNINFLIAINNR